MVYICWTYPLNDFIVVFIIMVTSEVSWKEATIVCVCVCVCGECVFMCYDASEVKPTEQNPRPHDHDHTEQLATKIGHVSGFCVGGQTCKKPLKIMNEINTTK